MTNPSSIVVEAPGRLHFGLYSFGGPGASYGGVGAMVRQPRVRLRAGPAREPQFLGAHAARAREFCQRWHAFHGRDMAPLCVQVEEAPPQHVGLGLGTALGLSVAAALRAFYGLPRGTAAELAASVGRGARSAVGAHGFLLGGLIAESGHEPNGSLSPLERRVELPDHWRCVLARPPADAGLSGATEADAFARLPPVPPRRREQLMEIARRQLLPAAERGDFAACSRAVHDFGRLAGECFAALQGGPYNGPQVAALVERARRLGFAGAGQSSWGPTVFVMAEDSAAAEHLAARLSRESGELTVEITAFSHRGAVVAAAGASQAGSS